MSSSPVDESVNPKVDALGVWHSLSLWAALNDLVYRLQ